jgi:DNA-binding transcriptional ArsR family regulator
MVTIKNKQGELIFKAIADPTRREILGLLRGGPSSVGELAQNFRTSRPAISKHLRLLQNAGLVVARRKGTANICELNGKPLRAVNEWLQDYAAFWDENLRSLKNYVEENQLTPQILMTRSLRRSSSMPRRSGFSRRWLIRASGSSGGERQGDFRQPTWNRICVRAERG